MNNDIGINSKQIIQEVIIPPTIKWKYESHYRGIRKVSHSISSESFVLFNQELDDSRFILQIKLLPLTCYYISVNCKGTNIEPQNPNGTGANVSLMDGWERSFDFNEGTGSFQGNFNFPFSTPSNGQVKIALRLGFYCCEAKGHAVFSNFHLFQIEQTHIFLSLPKSIKDFISAETITKFTLRINQCYEQMSKLYGKVPYEGRLIQIVLKKHEAWAYSGNPIVWNTQCCIDFFNELMFTVDNACFGIIHELGHDFDQTLVGSINPEFAANFALNYAVEQLNLPIYFNNKQTYGAGLQNGFYKEAYENSICKQKFTHDGLLYCVLRIKDVIGWKFFEDSIHYFVKNQTKAENALDAFVIWMETLSLFSSYDVYSTFKEDELEFIIQCLGSE